MDDTQTNGPATHELAATHTPAGEPPPNGPAEAPGAPSGAHDVPPEAPSGPPGFGERGRMRRRMRFLRKARELAYRDLGGLVFDLHRFGRRNDALVLAKLETIGRIDTELRALEATLAERQPVTVLREAGVAACPRCAAIHGSDDRFCPNCGLAMDLRAERPMAGPHTAAQAPPAPPAPPPPAPATTTIGMAAAASAPIGAHPVAQAAPAAAPFTPRAGDAPTTVAPAPSATAPPVPATAAPAPATPAPRPSTRAAEPQSTPATGDRQPTQERPSVEQPTEIVRPPVKDP